ITSRGTVRRMSSSEVPPCELPTSCCGITTTSVLSPRLHAGSVEVTAPRTLDTVFSEATTEGAFAASGTYTGTVVSVPPGNPSASSACSPSVYGPLLARAVLVGSDTLIVDATPAKPTRMPSPSTAAAIRCRMTRFVHAVQKRLARPDERHRGQSTR